MVAWALFFLVMTMIAALIAFAGIAVPGIAVAKGLAGVFLLLFFVFLYLAQRRPV